MQEYCFYIQYLAMNYGLPEFRPVTSDELRHVWAEHPELRRLVLEIERSRRVIVEVDRLYQVTHKAWRESTGSNLTALHCFKLLMAIERNRGR